MATSRRWALHWVAAAPAVAAGWLVGLLVWGRPERAGEFGDISFWWAPLLVITPTLPAMVGAGWLVPSQRRLWRTIGWVALVVSIVGGAYVAQFAHFGGICLDPGEDVCNVTWGSRSLALIAGLLAAGAGCATEWWRRRRLLSSEADPN